MTIPAEVEKEFEVQLEQYITSWTEQTLKEYGKTVREAAEWQEDKHPRDHGKFSSSPGAEGGSKADEGGKKKESGGKLPALKARAADLKAGATAMAKKLGGKVWTKLPGPMQKTLAVTHHYGKKVYGALEAPIHAGKALAMQVARERGLPPEHVEKVGRWIGIADGIGNWVHYAPMGHHVGHMLELGAWGSFGMAKAAMVTPWAALAYIGYSAVRCAACVYRAAKKAVTGKLKLGHQTHESREAETSADAVALCFAALQQYSDRAEWFEACLMAALDQTHDLAAAVKAASAVMDDSASWETRDQSNAGPEALSD